jgi:hypothetical protein
MNGDFGYIGSPAWIADIDAMFPEVTLDDLFPDVNVDDLFLDWNPDDIMPEVTLSDPPDPTAPIADGPSWRFY